MAAAHSTLESRPDEMAATPPAAVIPMPDPVKPDPDPDPELPSRDLVQRVERLELQVANQDTRITQLQQQIAGINAATAS